MNRFTIFTVILAVAVATVTVDLAARDYFEAKQLASVISPLGSGTPALIEQKPTVTTQQAPEPVAPKEEQRPKIEPAAPKVEPPAPKKPESSILTNLTGSKVVEAGFSGSIREAQFEGKIYGLLDITKNAVDGINNFEILEGETAIASVTEIVMPDEIRALNLYVLLQNKTKPYIDLSLNETNAYGDRSFYINHAKKPDEAFLAVKIGKRLYCFAYVKLYHPQLKKLIQLLIP